MTKYPTAVMAGLVPAIHVLLYCCMRGGWVYLITNKPNGILYAGVTSNLPRRAFEHREGLITGFTKRYGLKRLVYCEKHDDIRLAIQREKSLKRWPRAWKVRLIHAANPKWEDLYDQLGLL
jgi:putative endonuclease